MLDSLLLLVKNAGVNQPFLHVGNILATVENLAKMIGTEFLQNGDAKNAAIDSLIALLQSHKDPVK